jgi:PAS domain S-box-containing protein
MNQHVDNHQSGVRGSPGVTTSATSRLVLENVLDLLLDTVCVVDSQGRFVFVSAACEDLLGYTPAELRGRNMIDFVLPEDRERTLDAAASVMAGRSHIHFENRYMRKDGRVVDIMWSARWSEDEQLRIAVARNITARRHAERKQRVLYTISEAAHAAENLEVLYQDIHGVFSDMLPSDLFFVALYDEASYALTCPCFISESSQKPDLQHLDPESWLANVIRSREYLLLSGADVPARPASGLDGIEHYREWLGAPLVSPQGVMGALVMARRAGRTGYTREDGDLLQFASTQVATAIERKRAEARLLHIATHDPLTDLANRTLFEDRLRHGGQEGSSVQGEAGPALPGPGRLQEGKR